jgi:hypothetical protein
VILGIASENPIQPRFPKINAERKITAANPQTVPMSASGSRKIPKLGDNIKEIRATYAPASDRPHRRKRGNVAIPNMDRPRMPAIHRICQCVGKRKPTAPVASANPATPQVAAGM